MSQLIGVVAKPSHLAQQVGVVGAGVRVEFAAHDQGTDKGFTGQAAQVRLVVEMAQFPVVEPQRNLVRAFAFGRQRSAPR